MHGRTPDVNDYTPDVWNETSFQRARQIERILAFLCDSNRKRRTRTRRIDLNNMCSIVALRSPAAIKISIVVAIVVAQTPTAFVKVLMSSASPFGIQIVVAFSKVASRRSCFGRSLGSEEGEESGRYEPTAKNEY
jgi:hypothetical protein